MLKWGVHLPGDIYIYLICSVMQSMQGSSMLNCTGEEIYMYHICICPVVYIYPVGVVVFKASMVD